MGFATLAMFNSVQICASTRYAQVDETVPAILDKILETLERSYVILPGLVELL